MIRRVDGNDWLIISQIDHARLAGALAAHWGSEFVAPLPRPDLLIPAVENHDDGWKEWEQQPRVDRATGRPRNFTEMPLVEATAIWTRSIDRCAQSSAMGGVWVSLHFCWLARRASADDPAEAGAIERFLDLQAALQRSLRMQVESEFPGGELDALIDRGFRFLQAFDSMSLWLCCGEPTRPMTATLPDQEPLTFQPIDSRRIRVHPYPFSAPMLELHVPARRIPARRYEDDRQLREALSRSQPEQLGWVLHADATDGPPWREPVV